MRVFTHPFTQMINHSLPSHRVSNHTINPGLSHTLRFDTSITSEYVGDMPNPPYILNRSELARITRLIKTDPETQCWLWQGPQTPDGYGKHKRGPGHTDRIIHRIVWEHYKRQTIPEGMQLDHLCRVRLCCNPDHFEVVTPSENTLRQDHAFRNKTQCPQGHPYDDQNTRLTPDGKRVCRACDRARKRQPTPRTSELSRDGGDTLDRIDAGGQHSGVEGDINFP